MKLTEAEGKQLFQKHGIEVPYGVLIELGEEIPEVPLPGVVKAQVFFGDRKNAGLIQFIESQEDAQTSVQEMLGTEIKNEVVEKILVEEMVGGVEAEYYTSIIYDTDSRGPALLFTTDGGTGTDEASINPFSILSGPTREFITQVLTEQDVAEDEHERLIAIITKLWTLVTEEDATLAEINPLIKRSDGTFIAADAKVMLDDARYAPGERRFLKLDGDIGVLASGGGASMLCMDALLYYGGNPANYTEYSGNPPREVVAEMTKRVLARPNLKGLWVVGGFAGFTDIYETLSGFVEGLRQVEPKPTFPIVIRRDGPRREEAFEMLREVGEQEGFDFHLYGSEISMAESARILVEKINERTA